MNATRKALDPKAEAAVEPGKDVAMTPAKPAPLFVEAETLFERMAHVTNEIASRAFDMFRTRGGEWGRELDDWFKAEREVLRPVPVEIKENDTNILVTAAVPGFKPEEIEVSIKDNQLILSGETKASEETKDENVIVQEWKSNRFLRQFTLPSNVDANNIQAHLKDGLLELTMPKAPAEEATKIPVKPA
jgi:HSP20 family protein